MWKDYGRCLVCLLANGLTHFDDGGSRLSLIAAQKHLLLFFVAFVTVRLVLFCELRKTHFGVSDSLASFFKTLACLRQENST